jgi:hypothetical protein
VIFANVRNGENRWDQVTGHAPTILKHKPLPLLEIEFAMHTAIKLPLKSLDPTTVQDLQKKYPSAMVRIETEIPSEGAAMSEEQFWGIIALLDWGRKNSQDIIAPAVEALSLFSEEDIFRFDQILAEKLYALDRETFARVLGWDASSHSRFSADVFLYARCCAVANGREFYEKLLQKPSIMPKEHTFEPLLYLAEQAHRLKTGSDRYDFLPTLSYEMFSNPSGWPNGPSLPELVKGNLG